MRKEDEQAIKRAIAILKVTCQEQKDCASCRFYDTNKNTYIAGSDCLLNRPPAYYSIDDIIKCFT